MRWIPGLLFMVACVFGETGRPSSEADTDTDTDADTDTDTDTDTDADAESFLINFDAESCGSATTTVAPGPGESEMLAAALLGPASWPYQVNAVNVGLANAESGGAECDASLAHEISVWVLEPGVLEPPTATDPDYTLSVGEVMTTDPARLLSRPLDPPLVLNQGQNIAVAIRFSGTFPDTSCVNACSAEFESGLDFWSNAQDPPYDWQLLSDFGILSNLWIFAEGELLD